MSVADVPPAEASSGPSAPIDGGPPGTGSGPPASAGAGTTGDVPPLVLAPGVPDQADLPPVTALAIATLALVLVGGIYLAAYLPRHAPLGPAIGLVAASAVVMAVNVGGLARTRPFPWAVFRQVAGWALLAYLVIAGILAFVFIHDGTRGAMLGLLAGMLAVFAVNVPLLLGFSVARYQPVSGGDPA